MVQSGFAFVKCYSIGVQTMHVSSDKIMLINFLQGDKKERQMNRVGQNHIIIRIYGVHTVFIAGKSPFLRSYTVYIYSSGQPHK